MNFAKWRRRLHSLLNNQLKFVLTPSSRSAQQIKDGMFIESAEVHGNVYGTSFATVQDQIEAGRTCILDIDVQGVRNVKASDMAAHYVFIAPPSMALLEERLRARGTEKEEAIVKRLANAQGEMDYGSEEGAFDVTVVNNDLETASVEFVAAIEKLAGIV